MPFGKITKEFDHLDYLPAIQRMYDANDIEEMKEFATFSQLERFKKEIETLNEFGLHKKLDVKIKESEDGRTAARKYSDGKVDLIFSVSSAKISETYKTASNKKRYRRKINNAFIESTVVKSNKKLTYDEKNPPHCMNCGSPMQEEAENYYCPFCRTKYAAESYKYHLGRFFVEGALRDLRFIWIIIIPAAVLSILQLKGFITESEGETITIIISFILAVALTVLFFYSLAKGIKGYMNHKKVQKKIRQNDPNFSSEIFTLRLNDILTTHPEVLISEKEEKDKTLGIICRNLMQLQFQNYTKVDDQEIVECSCKVDALYLRGDPGRVRLEDKTKKIKIRVKRAFGTLTPVHYAPDQFTCKSCGSHQEVEHDGMQVCSYCRTKIPMENIDWVLDV